MQQMIAPFRADVEPVGGWRAALPSHRLFGADLSDAASVPRALPPTAPTARELVAEALAAPRLRRPAGLRRLTRSVLAFLERPQCAG
jgi:hypothetical protein